MKESLIVILYEKLLSSYLLSEGNLLNFTILLVHVRYTGLMFDC